MIAGDGPEQCLQAHPKLTVKCLISLQAARVSRLDLAAHEQRSDVPRAAGIALAEDVLCTTVLEILDGHGRLDGSLGRLRVRSECPRRETAWSSQEGALCWPPEDG